MAFGNQIIDLSGGTASMNIIGVRYLIPTHELEFTHKDGTITLVDLTSLGSVLQVGKVTTLPNGDIEMEVTDPNPPGGGTPVTSKVIIPMSHKADLDYVNAELDKKVDKVPGLGLSEEDFTTILKAKLDALAPDNVTKVEYLETVAAGVTTGQDIIISTDGAAGLKTNVISKLFDKVEKEPGKGLSEEDFTTILKKKLDTFDVTGLKDITFNTATTDVSGVDYEGNTRVLFRLPTAVQSDWGNTTSSHPAFIKNKQIVQDQIDTNRIDIANNASDIANGAASDAAQQIQIDKNKADILVNAGAIADNTVDIASLRTDMTGVQADINGVQTDATNLATRVTTNEIDIAALQTADGNADGRIQALETEAARNAAADVVLEGRVSASEGQITSLQTDTAANTAGITANDSEIAKLQGLTANQETRLSANEAVDVVQRVDIDKNTADILALTAGASLTDNQIRDAVERATNSNVYNDVDNAKVDNLPANQGAVDAAQDVRISTLENTVVGNIVDNLTSTEVNRPLSANQGRVLNVTKAPLLSPALQGNPTSVTPAAGDNDTSIATTEFVNTAIAAAGGTGVVVNSLTSTSVVDALSANMGRFLDQKKENMLNTPDHNGMYLTSDTAGNRSWSDAVNVIDNLTSSSIVEALSANQGRVLENKKIEVDDYATDKIGGTVKVRVDVDTLYITTNGSNA